MPFERFIHALMRNMNTDYVITSTIF